MPSLTRPPISFPLDDCLIRILAGKHAESLHGEGELVVGVRDHAALVEDALDRLLQPLAVGLLALHDQPDALLDGLLVRVVGLHEADQRPRRHDHLGAGGMLDVFACLAGLVHPSAG